MSTTKSVEDELFELLNSPDPVISSKLVDSEGISSSIQPISYSDPQDFLSWLDDTSPTKIMADNKPRIETEPTLNSSDFNLLSNLDEVASSSTLALPIVEEKQSTDSASQRTNSIYDEMFGATETEISNNVSTPIALSQALPITIDVSNFEDSMDAILSSPFPDVARLRELIDKNGYIPGHQRLSALLLLLTGSCHADEEADQFSVPASEREFHRDLVSDTQSLIRSCYTLPALANVEYDLIDVVILYCQRRSIDYKNIFSRLLISIFGDANHHQSKALVSSCFYSLMSQFIPMVSLQYSELGLATDAMHTWLRLLVIYHSPTLAQHLDRVLPGWEKKAKELTSSQSSKLSTLQKASSALDSLEKELGLDLGFEDFDNDLGMGNESSAVTTASIQSAPPKSSTNNGMIHSHWMTTLFAGSIPASQSASLLDWAVFNGERYAGVYFMASLLEIHAPSLEQMNAPQLTQFFDKIATNESNWFANFTTKQTNWTDFTEAWIHATTVLINNTPNAFKQALLRTESWAVIAAEKQRRELSSQVQSLKQQSKALFALGDDLENDNFFETSLDEPVHGGSVADKLSNSSNKKMPKMKTSSTSQIPSFDAASSQPSNDGDEDDDALMEDAQMTPHTYSTMANSSGLTDVNDDTDDEDDENEEEDRDDIRSNNGAEKATDVGVVGGVARRASTLLMDNLRSLTAKLSATAVSAGSMGVGGGVDALPRGPQHFPPLPPGVDPSTTERFPQDTKLGVDTSCLWCDASEIIPSICGSQRRFAGGHDVSSSSTSSTNNTVSAEEAEVQGLVRATFQHRLLQPLHRRCFFLSNSVIGQGGNTVSSSNAPWYFAIDCRSPQEKELGLFPKAYSVDPDLITDSDALSHLLAVLDPLKNTVHITIIGAGNAWHRFFYRQHHPRKYAHAIQRPPHSEPLELQRQLQEEHNHVHAIAVFLIKRGFRFISVVDGGFVAAVEALNRPDSRFSMQASLVDSDRATLSALLGVSNTVVATSTERVVHCTSSSLGGNGPAPSSLLMASPAAALAMSGSFSVQSHQQQYHTSAQASSSSSQPQSSQPEPAHTQSNQSHPLSLSIATSTSSAPQEAASAASGSASLAALSKNVGSLLSTWVTSTSSSSSTAGSAQHTTESPQPPQVDATHTGASVSNAVSTTSSASTVTAATGAFAGWGSSLMGKGLDTLKKGWGVTANLTATATHATSAPPPPPSQQEPHDQYVKDPSTSFIIGDNEDDDDDGHQHKYSAIADSHAIGITRTDQERAQALALHRLAGLRKGDFIRITRDELPGAILFPCIKMKKMSVMVKKPHENNESLLDLGDEHTGESDVMMVEQEIPVSRYLVITRERFIVLDTHVGHVSHNSEGADAPTAEATEPSDKQQKAGGVGSQAMVKSNHHLTELIKMTFKKKDPELVTLFLLSASGESKPRQYRVVKYKDFVATLQKNMERFKI